MANVKSVVYISMTIIINIAYQNSYINDDNSQYSLSNVASQYSAATSFLLLRSFREGRVYLPEIEVGSNEGSETESKSKTIPRNAR